MLVKIIEVQKGKKPSLKYKRKELKRQKFRVNDEGRYEKEERISWKREKGKQR